jgi:hypothetical protein
MVKKQAPQRRKRGVFLSNTGWQRLQAIERRFETQENGGIPYTLETLSAKTGLSPNTITKVRRQQAAVDRQTLETYFAAFGLQLSVEDCQTVDSPNGSGFSYDSIRGQMAPDSPLYVNHPALEILCQETLLQPGSLLHIRGPHQSGKTSLMGKTLSQIQGNGLTTVLISLKLADQSILQSSEKFFRWFCAVVTRRLELPNRLPELWDDLLGNSFNCTDYFERYLLPELSEPLVIALDDIDTLLEAPGIALDFFNMLRTWHERARYGDESGILWQTLRLVLVHSSQAYLSDLFFELPLQLGITVDVPNFTPEQVIDLTQRYEFDSPADLAQKLIHFLNGNPSLTQLALHKLGQQTMCLDQILGEYLSPDSIFAEHLLQCVKVLQQHPDILDSFKLVIQANQPVRLPPMQTFKLNGLGLIYGFQQKAVPRCHLYQVYFNQVLL